MHFVPFLCGKDPGFLPWTQLLGHVDVARLMGWDAVLDGHLTCGLWEDHHLMWHINCLEMKAVFLSPGFDLDSGIRHLMGLVGVLLL